MRSSVPLYLAVIVDMGQASVEAADLGCNEWNSEDVFQVAVFVDVIRCLEAGADVHARDKEGNTPVYWAAAHEDPAIVDALLAAGADSSVRNIYGYTSLHAAASNENAAIARALLEAGADPNARNFRKSGPLHHAAGTDNIGVVVALLEAGADPAMRNSAEHTPLHSGMARRGPCPVIRR